MSRFVLDASVVLTWCFPDEKAQKAEEVSERIAAGDTAVVTVFWPHEVLNALLVGERRKRLTPELTAAFLQDLKHLALHVDTGITTSDVFQTIQELCRRHKLTSYDAAYLELAIREDHPLATVDDDLVKAAQTEGVTLI